MWDNGLAVFLLLAACDSSPTRTSEERSVNLGESFELRVGETVRIEGTDFSLTFREVREDSRCPIDVTCVRAGEARVVLDVEADDATTELVFEVPPQGGDEQLFRDHVIRILGLSPQAESGKRIDPESYVATVRVEER